MTLASGFCVIDQMQSDKIPQLPYSSIIKIGILQYRSRSQQQYFDANTTGTIIQQLASTAVLLVARY